MKRTMQRTLLALALITTAGVSYAQTMASREPVNPYGGPFIGRNDWVRQPGDQPGPSGKAAVQPGPQYGGAAPMDYGSNVATAPATQPSAMQPMTPMDAAGSRQATFKDEYGFRYDSQGNRLDARGNVISPHVPQR